MDSYNQLAHQFFGSLNLGLISLEDFVSRRQHDPFVDLSGEKLNPKRMRLAEEPALDRRRLKQSFRCMICCSALNSNQKGDDDLLRAFINLIRKEGEEVDRLLISDTMKRLEGKQVLCQTCYSAAEQLKKTYEVMKQLEQEVFTMRAKFISAIQLSARISVQNDDLKAFRRHANLKQFKAVAGAVQVLRNLLLGKEPDYQEEVDVEPVAKFRQRPPRRKAQEPHYKEEVEPEAEVKPRPIRKKAHAAIPRKRLTDRDIADIKDVVEDLISSVERMTGSVPNQNQSLEFDLNEDYSMPSDSEEMPTDSLNDDMLDEYVPSTPPSSPEVAQVSRRKRCRKSSTRKSMRKIDMKGIKHPKHFLNLPADQLSKTTAAQWLHKLRGKHPDLSHPEIRRLRKIRKEPDHTKRLKLEESFWEEMKQLQPDINLERNGAFAGPQRMKGVRHPNHTLNLPAEKLSKRATAQRVHRLRGRHPDLSHPEIRRLNKIRRDPDVDQRLKLEESFWEEMKLLQPDINLERNGAFAGPQPIKGVKHPNHFSNLPAEKLSMSIIAQRRRKRRGNHPDLSQPEMRRLIKIRNKPDYDERLKLEERFWEEMKLLQPDIDLERNGAFAESKPPGSGGYDKKRGSRIVKITGSDGKIRSFYKDVEIKVDEETELFKCANCNYSNKEIWAVSRHINTNHIGSSQNDFKCQHCDRTFYYNHLLSQHLVAKHHILGRFLCATCGDTFASPGALHSHNSVVHLGIKPHLCDHCGKSFGRRKDRDLHVRRHTGDRPFICHVCAQAFFENTSLKNHIRKNHPDAAKELPPKANPGRSKSGQGRINRDNGRQNVTATSSIPVVQEVEHKFTPLEELSFS